MAEAKTQGKSGAQGDVEYLRRINRGLLGAVGVLLVALLLGLLGSCGPSSVAAPGAPTVTVTVGEPSTTLTGVPTVTVTAGGPGPAPAEGVEGTVTVTPGVETAAPTATGSGTDEGSLDGRWRLCTPAPLAQHNARWPLYSTLPIVQTG